MAYCKRGLPASPFPWCSWSLLGRKLSGWSALDSWFPGERESNQLFCAQTSRFLGSGLEISFQFRVIWCLWRHICLFRLILSDLANIYMERQVETVLADSLDAYLPVLVDPLWFGPVVTHCQDRCLELPVLIFLSWSIGIDNTIGIACISICKG